MEQALEEDETASQGDTSTPVIPEDSESDTTLQRRVLEEMGPTLPAGPAKKGGTPGNGDRPEKLAKPVPLFLEPELTKAEGDRAAALKQQKERKKPPPSASRARRTPADPKTTRGTKRAATAEDRASPQKPKRATFTGTNKNKI